MSIEKLKNVSINSSTPDLSFLFDIKSILKNTPDKRELSVTLKNQPVKGNSLFATKPIQKGETIAYYKMKVFTNVDYKDKIKRYTKQELKLIKDMSLSDEKVATQIGRTKQSVYCKRWAMKLVGSKRKTKKSKTVTTPEVVQDVVKNATETTIERVVLGNVSIDLVSRTLTIKF